MKIGKYKNQIGVCQYEFLNFCVIYVGVVYEKKELYYYGYSKNYAP
ncbi:hypothetical protein ES703_13047 [subsurface metagenome]